MKRLLLTFGLAIAFFVPSVQASVFDFAPWVGPKVDTYTSVKCRSNSGSIKDFPHLGECLAYYEDVIDRSELKFDSQCLYDEPYQKVSCTYMRSIGQSADFQPIYARTDPSFYATVYFGDSTESLSCPPDTSPSHIFAVDYDSNGKTDRCYDPADLNELSDCSAAPDLLGNSSGQTGDICMTQPNGAQCGYSAGSNGSMSKTSGVSCYDDTPVDEFGGEDIPNIEPDQCVPFGFGYACSADPAEICYGGVCPSDCGTVNDQFVCFNDTPNLPDSTDPTNPDNDLDPTEGDPDTPPTVEPTDPTNPLSQDLATTNNRLGDLIALTRDKGNDMIYAINKQTGELMGQAKESNSLLTSLLEEVQKGGDNKDVTEGLTTQTDELVAAVDRNTGEIISVMRESQVKLADLGENIFLTKDIQQGVLTATLETKEEIKLGFTNVIEFIKTLEEPDPETGETEMDRLLATNSDGFGQIQALLNELLTKPGIESPGGGSELPVDPETGEEVVPDAMDFTVDLAVEGERVASAFDTTAIDQQILDVQESLRKSFSEIKGAFSEQFNISLGGAGALPVLGVIEYGGKSTSVSLEPYATELNLIGVALLFMVSLSALFIVFR